MPKYKQIVDKIILEKVALYVISNKIKGVTNQGAFFTAIGASPGSAYNIKTGKQSFTVEHILNCCKQFNISADYIYGLSTEMERKQTVDPLTKLKLAVAELEQLAKTKDKK